MSLVAVLVPPSIASGTIIVEVPCGFPSRKKNGPELIICIENIEIDICIENIERI